MDVLLILKALILGLVEAASEFLPISSTGHLIIVGDFLDFTGPRAEAFEIFIQLGAILSVVWIYRERLGDTILHLSDDPKAQRLVVNLMIAFVPAATLGFFFTSRSPVICSIRSPWPGPWCWAASRFY